MNWSLKLMKIKGIDIKVHLTFVLILVGCQYRRRDAGRGLRLYHSRIDCIHPRFGATVYRPIS